jgi:hypothetical protein
MQSLWKSLRFLLHITHIYKVHGAPCLLCSLLVALLHDKPIATLCICRTMRVKEKEKPKTKRGHQSLCQKANGIENKRKRKSGADFVTKSSAYHLHRDQICTLGYIKQDAIKFARWVILNKMQSNSHVGLY